MPETRSKTTKNSRRIEISFELDHISASDTIIVIKNFAQVVQKLGHKENDLQAFIEIQLETESEIKDGALVFTAASMMDLNTKKSCRDLVNNLLQKYCSSFVYCKNCQKLSRKFLKVERKGQRNGIFYAKCDTSNCLDKKDLRATSENKFIQYLNKLTGLKCSKKVSVRRKHKPISNLVGGGDRTSSNLAALDDGPSSPASLSACPLSANERFQTEIQPDSHDTLESFSQMSTSPITYQFLRDQTATNTTVPSPIDQDTEHGSRNRKRKRISDKENNSVSTAGRSTHPICRQTALKKGTSQNSDKPSCKRARVEKSNGSRFQEVTSPNATVTGDKHDSCVTYDLLEKMLEGLKNDIKDHLKKELNKVHTELSTLKTEVFAYMDENFVRKS